MTTQVKHTPGPWFTVELEEDEYPRHMPGDKRLFGDNNVCIGILFGGLEETRRAQPLIAAAPALLEACKAAIGYFQERNLGETAVRLQADIRKAVEQAEQ